MATRSTIAKLESDGRVTSVYCHWDGYPSNNGKILLEHYQSEAQVDRLLAGGSLSALGKTIGKKHPFDSRSTEHENMCLYYHRDRGESREDTEEQKYICLAEFLMSDRGAYTYLWTPEGWKYGSGGPNNTRLVPLTQEACEKCAYA